MDEHTTASSQSTTDTRPTRRSIAAIAVLACLAALAGGIAVGQILSRGSSTREVDEVTLAVETDTTTTTDTTPTTTAPDTTDDTPSTSTSQTSVPQTTAAPATTAATTTSTTSTTTTTTTAPPAPQLSFPTLVVFGDDEFATITITNTGEVAVAWSPGPADPGVTYHNPGSTLAPGASAQLTIGVAGPTDQAFTKSASIQYGGNTHGITLRRQVLGIVAP
jgi:hypothetical protein